MTDREATVFLLKERVHALCVEKQWGDEGVQNPQQVAMAMTVEMSELLEHFQWMTPSGVERLMAGQDAGRARDIAGELADVLMYALQLARTLEIDITGEILRKIEIVKRRPNSRQELIARGEIDAR